MLGFSMHLSNKSETGIIPKTCFSFTLKGEAFFLHPSKEVFGVGGIPEALWAHILAICVYPVWDGKGLKICNCSVIARFQAGCDYLLPVFFEAVGWLFVY